MFSAQIFLVVVNDNDAKEKGPASLANVESTMIVRICRPG
jgi:hypothetical protein